MKLKSMARQGLSGLQASRLATCRLAPKVRARARSGPNGPAANTLANLSAGGLYGRKSQLTLLASHPNPWSHR